MLLICKISVVVLVAMGDGEVPWFVSADVKGKVTSTSTTKYLVDFSEDAKARKFQGDYSAVLVEKNKCVGN